MQQKRLNLKRSTIAPNHLIYDTTRSASKTNLNVESKENINEKST